MSEQLDVSCKQKICHQSLNAVMTASKLTLLSLSLEVIWRV